MGLTERQQEVVDLLALGMSTEDIANKLWVTKNTVRNHIQHIMDKMDVDTGLALVHKERMFLTEAQETGIRQVFDRGRGHELPGFGFVGGTAPWVMTATYTACSNEQVSLTV